MSGYEITDNQQCARKLCPPVREVSSLQAGFNGIGTCRCERWPHFRRCYVQVLMELGPEHVSLLERCRVLCTGFNGVVGSEDVSLSERCPHFRGCYVQASMELGVMYMLQ